jgi:hypothetical protein
MARRGAWSMLAWFTARTARRAIPMRSAYIAAATVVAVGAFLAIAAVAGFGPAAIGIGVIAIAVLGAVVMVAGPSASTTPAAATGVPTR